MNVLEILHRKIKNIVKLGTFAENKSNSIASVTVNGSKVKVLDMQHYGFFSIPSGKKDSLILFPEGKTTGICICKKDTPPVVIESGEVIVYTEKGFVKIKQDGSIESKGDWKHEGDIEVTGNLADNKGSLNEYRELNKTHTHVDSNGGATTTSTQLNL